MYQENVLCNELYFNIRKSVLQKNLISYPESIIITYCFILLWENLGELPFEDDSTCKDRLLKIYNNKYKERLDNICKLGLYSIVNFPQLLDILSGNKLLGKAVEYVHCYIKGKIEDRENPSENEVFDRMVLGIGIVSPYEYLQLNTDYSCVLHSVSLPDYPIYRDKDLQYHIEDTSLNFGLVLGACNEDGIDTDYLIDFPDLACIWPSQYGFARCLSRQGIWGFIRMEDFSIQWLDKSVIYADDFLCERARITYQNRNIHCFNYVDLCLNPILNIPLNKAGHFVDGIATVGDEYCDSYRINVFGKIIEEDKERYQNLKNKHIQAELESKKRFNDLIRKRRNQDSYDPESEIMNSLTGHGADPEIFGF